MTVPDFQTLMAPILKSTEDGRIHGISETAEAMAIELGLAQEDREELIPSGRQSRLHNRCNWALIYLKNAGLVESPSRGKYKITARGLQALKESPKRIDIKYLSRFPEFLKFRESTPRDQKAVPVMDKEVLSQTPEELLDSTYASLRQQLAIEILEHIKTCSPRFFEQLVVDMLVTMGYGGSRADAGLALGRSGDGGVDGIIKEDKLGLDVIYLQAKRWDGTVGRPVVQAFAGSLEGHRAWKGVLITTSHFSEDALDYVTKIEKKIVLIDGELLAQLMIDHGLGVNEVTNYSIKKIDLDYFGEDEA